MYICKIKQSEDVADKSKEQEEVELPHDELTEFIIVDVRLLTQDRQSVG
jgi:hypothetical protein